MNAFSSALHVIGRGLGDWWRHWVSMAALNLAWLVCWATVLLGPPATLALYSAVRSTVRGRDITLSDLWSTGRRYFFTSWLWLLANALVFGVLWLNLTLYAQVTAAWAPPLALLALGVGVIWLLAQFFILPFLLEQERPRLGQAIRNGFLTMFASPLYTLVLMLFVALLGWVSVYLVAPLFLGVPCLIAVLGVHAVRERLETFGIRKGGA